MGLPAPVRGGAYGGGLATPGDLSRFLTALRQRTLLGEEHTGLLFAGPADGPAVGRGYAYGFDTRRANGGRAVGHGGSAPGVHTEAYMYPGGYDAVILSNYDAAASPSRSGAGALIVLLDDLLMR